MLSGGCRNVPRHASRKVNLSELRIRRASEVVQKLLRTCPQSCSGSPDTDQSRRILAVLGHCFDPMLPNSGQIQTKLADAGHIFVEIMKRCLGRAGSCSISTKIARIGTGKNMSESGRKLIDFDQNRPNWQNMARIGQISWNLGRVLDPRATFGQAWGTLCATT